MKRFVIEIPDAEPGQLQAIAREAGQMEGVQDAGVSQTRGLDPVSLMAWVQLGSAVASAVGAAVPVIQKILDLLRLRGHKNAHIRFPDGTEIQVEATPEEVARLLGKARGEDA